MISKCVLLFSMFSLLLPSPSFPGDVLEGEFILLGVGIPYPIVDTLDSHLALSYQGKDERGMAVIHVLKGLGIEQNLTSEIVADADDFFFISNRMITVLEFDEFQIRLIINPRQKGGKHDLVSKINISNDFVLPLLDIDECVWQALQHQARINNDLLVYRNCDWHVCMAVFEE